LELHIAFGYSVAGSLRAAFGPNANVARFSDDLSVGPINPVEASGRRTWIDAHIGYDNPDITEDERAFWPRALDPTASRIAWFSRRNAHEYCGFLEYLRRLGNMPTDIVDVTDVQDEDGEYFRSVGSIPTQYIAQIAIKRRSLTAKDRADFLTLWNRMRADDAELRVLTGDLSLSSKSLSHYDESLAVLTGDSWRSMALVLGEALNHWPMSDLFLQSRLYALADNGQLDMRDTGRRYPDVKKVQP
jgi:hypothetical protein